MPHHSAATFDATKTFPSRASSRAEWANPHVYLWLAVPGASGDTVEWEVEGQPPAMLRRLGWSEVTLTVGDAIEVTGNPARNPQRQSLLLVSMQRADTTLYDGKNLISALTTLSAAPAGAADGIAGVWVTLLDVNAMTSYLNPARVVPLTQRGVAARAATQEATMSSALECSPTPAPAFMFAPDIKRITLGEGLIRIAGEFSAGTAARSSSRPRISRRTRQASASACPRARRSGSSSGSRSTKTAEGSRTRSSLRTRRC